MTVLAFVLNELKLIIKKNWLCVLDIAPLYNLMYD